MQGTEILNTITLIFAVLGVGGITGVIKIANDNGKKTARMEGSIKSLEKNYDTLRQELGNGGFGIKKEIQQMQLKCAGQMTKVESELKNHLSAAAHPGIAEKIATLETRVDILEDK